MISFRSSGDMLGVWENHTRVERGTANMVVVKIFVVIIKKGVIKNIRL